MKTVGIWGFYFAENFGDDLMAIQIAKMLKSIGVNPLIFDLSPILAARFELEATADICDFCIRSELIIIGGGNLLAQKHTWPNGPFMKKICELRMAAEHFMKDIHALSIGGDGVAETVYPHSVERLLKSKCFKGALVRIKSDVRSLENIKVKASYAPDILWSSAHFFGITQPLPKSTQKTIGIHFLSNSPWIVSGINRFRSRINQKFPSIHFKYLSAFLHDGSSGDFMPDQDQANESTFHNGDPIEVMRCISSLDCVISQRLHVGLISLSMQIPFISMLAHPKVKAEMTQIGWNQTIDYTGLKPRRYFGERWLASQIGLQVARLDHASSSLEVPVFYSPHDVFLEYKKKIDSILLA
jgi:polysaccharide pyruvyl transferase WcaK-like protein